MNAPLGLALACDLGRQPQRFQYYNAINDRPPAGWQPVVEVGLVERRLARHHRAPSSRFNADANHPGSQDWTHPWFSNWPAMPRSAMAGHHSSPDFSADEL